MVCNAARIRPFDLFRLAWRPIRATTANIAQLIGATTLPLLTGMLPPLFPLASGGGYAPDAYRAMFAVLALVLGAGLCVYATFREGSPTPPASGAR